MCLLQADKQFHERKQFLDKEKWKVDVDELIGGRGPKPHRDEKRKVADRVGEITVVPVASDESTRL